MFANMWKLALVCILVRMECSCEVYREYEDIEFNKAYATINKLYNIICNISPKFRDFFFLVKFDRFD